MADLNEIVSWLDKELNISGIKDYPGAVNGLQMQNNGEVCRIVSAVDASLAVVEEAAREGGLLLVHHGMFWQGAQPVVGAVYRKMKAALEGNLAIYAAHLPLDVHPVFGNNVLLAREIGLTDVQPILIKDGMPMGVSGNWGKSKAELSDAVSNAVGRPVHVCSAGKDFVDSVGVMTGGAGSEVGKVVNLGLDAFVTGEGPHWSYIEAEELGFNVFYAGHYATETFGVRVLGELLGREFGIGHQMIERLGGL
ncbi:MAG: Nif3-like dinuclear metal center hexameric protein [Luteolibacter sp.]